MLNVEMLIRLT